MIGNQAREAGWTDREFAEAVDGIGHAALSAVVTLGVVDHLRAHPSTSEEIAGAVGCSESALRRLLAFLSCRGMFDLGSDGRYHLTERSRLLARTHESGLFALLDGHGLASRVDRALVDLPEVVQSGRAAYPAVFGASFYDDESTELRETFDRLRATHSARIGSEIAELLVGPAASTETTAASWRLVDLGGGLGSVARALVRVAPRLDVLVLDLPSTVARARDVDQHPRVGFIGQSFFDSLPVPADAYLMVNVVHNWDDSDATQLLTNCAAAARAGATTRKAEVIVVERPTDIGEPLAVTAMDIRALAILGGRERTLNEYTVLARAAGLELVDVQLSASGLALMRYHP